MSNITIDDETLVLWNLSNGLKKLFNDEVIFLILYCLIEISKINSTLTRKTQQLLWKFYRSLEEKEMSPDTSNNMQCNFFT